MFEISIFCVILLAICYWAVLWLMGRREDVLHGEFVENDPQSNEPIQSSTPEPPPVRPIFPARRAFTTRPVLPKRPMLPERRARTAVPDQPAFRPERLQSLLESIKQDLNQLVQK